MMALILNNFGKIQEAAIETNGLTLIAGRNNTGKSTIGKCLYSIIKALNEYEEDFELLDRAFFINEQFSPLIFEFVKKATRQTQLVQELKEIREKFNSKDKREEVYLALTKNVMSDYLKRMEKYFKSKTKENIVLNIRSAKERLLKKYSKRDKFQFILRRRLLRMFSGSILNSLHQNLLLSVSYEVENKNIFRTDFFQNGLRLLEFNENNTKISFADATFIKTPLLLEEGIYGCDFVDSDLEQKLNNAFSHLNEFSYNASLLDKMGCILEKASFVYDVKQNRLQFQVSPKAEKLEISNIASGMKNLGILYALLKSNSLRKDTLLILDEPENHLHPEWQLQYAEILALMVKEGFYILLTSHSPDFIQALKIYLEQYSVWDKAKFYFAHDIEGQENLSIIEDVTHDTNKIFEDLRKPLDRFFK